MSKVEYDAQGVAPTDFSPAPAGVYHMVIVDYTEKVNKHGLPSYRIECEIDEQNMASKKVWHNINLLPKDNKGAGIAIHFLKTIGEPWQGKFDVDADNWIGRRFIGRLTIVKNQNGNDVNELSGVSPEAAFQAESKEVKDRWKNKKAVSADVPF